jgi:2-alkyl-3-oxoalkanoate reductase
MQALVTGACGFIGSHLTPRLLDEGMEVRALAFPGEDAEGLESLGAEVRFGDITDPQSLEGLCDGVDIVFHLAGRIAIWGPRKAFFASIVEGTRNLLEESSGKVSRFVYASSVCAIGTNRHLVGHGEDDPVRKTGIPYADAKQEAEKLVWKYHEAEALEGTVFRPTNVIGPGSVWVRDIIDTLRNGILPLFDGGRYSASLVYVDNLVDGIVLASTLDIGSGRTYQFRDDWDVTWKHYLSDLGAVVDKKPRGSIPFRVIWPLAFLFEKALSELNVKPPATRHIVGLMGRDLDVDNTRAKEELGWRTRVSYEEAMQRITEWVLAGMQ